MASLFVVNNSNGQPLYLEVFPSTTFEPQRQSLKPMGPYLAKHDEQQSIGYWAETDIVVYLYRSGEPGTTSFDRIQIKSKPATIVVDGSTHRMFVTRVYQGIDVYTGPPRLPVWAQWTIFGLVVAAVLALVAVCIWRTVVTRGGKTFVSEETYDNGDDKGDLVSFDL